MRRIIILNLQDPHNLHYGLPPMVGGMKRLGEDQNGGSSQMDMLDGHSSDEDSQVDTWRDSWIDS